MKNSHKHHAEIFQIFKIDTYCHWFVLNKNHLDLFMIEKAVVGTLFVHQKVQFYSGIPGLFICQHYQEKNDRTKTIGDFLSTFVIRQLSGKQKKILN